MKKILTFVLVLSLVSGMSLMAGTKEFSKGSSFITGEFGLSSFGTPLGVSFELGLKENIGVGASFLYQSWGYDLGIFGDFNQTLLSPSVFVAYHFNNLDLPKFDISVGASAGFSIYSSDWEDEVATGGMFVSLVATVRYYITDKIAISLKESYSLLGDWAGSYTLLGITYKLK